MSPLRYWAVWLWRASLAAGLLNVTVLRDAEVAAGVLLGLIMAITTLVAAPYIERYDA